MLLFLLSFYLHYDLIYCEDKENVKFNESLLVDMHYQHLLQIHELLKDVQPKLYEMSALMQGEDKHGIKRDEEFFYDNISDLKKGETTRKDQKDQEPKDHKTLTAVFRPSAKYKSLPTIFDRRQGLFHHHWHTRLIPDYNDLLSPLVIRHHSSPRPTALTPSKSPGRGQRRPYPGYLLIPINSVYSGLLPNGSTSPQTVSVRPPIPFIMSSHSYTLRSTRPAPKESSYFMDFDHVLQKLPHLLNPLRPTISSPIPHPALYSSSPIPHPALYSSSPFPQPAISFFSLIPHQALSSRTSRPVTTFSSSISTQTMSQNEKDWLEAKAPYIDTKTNGLLKYQSILNDTKRTTEPVTNRDTAQLFTKDKNTFSAVTLPKKDERPDTIPTDYKNWVLTTARDVLDGKNTTQKPSSLKQRYLQMMDRLNEGYMMVFVLEFCRLVGLKNKREVRNVLLHTKRVYNTMWKTGRLDWITDPLQFVIRKLIILVAEGNIDVVQGYAYMMFHMLLERRETLSSEVNSIMDVADAFYTDGEGYDLLNSLKEFEEHPKTTKSDYWLCRSFIENFLRPFQRRSSLRRRKRLLKSINNAIEERFPLLMRKNNTTTVADEEKPKNGSKQRKRKRKGRLHLRHEQKLIKRHRIPEYNDQDKDHENPILKSMQPLTYAAQPQFRGTTSQFSLRKKPRSSTTANL